MIELFVFLFVLQGDSTEEWLESCRTDFPAYAEMISEANPDVFFCKYVNILDLSAVDVERLGREMNWLNYAMQTVDDFISDWEFYQEHAYEETLMAYPRISMRDSLPPSMRVTISFNYTENGQDKYFEKPFKVNPLNLHPVCNDEVEGYPCIPKEDNLLQNDDPDSGSMGTEDPINQTHECLPTSRWNADSQSCETWWSSVGTVIALAVITVSAIFSYYYFRIIKNQKQAE